MIELLLLIIIGLMFPMWALGTFAFICVFKAKRLPMDTSNRINHIRLLWFALTRPHEFVRWFEWMRRDEWDNVNR